jgi:hypothetical protein
VTLLPEQTGFGVAVAVGAAGGVQGQTAVTLTGLHVAPPYPSTIKNAHCPAGMVTVNVNPSAAPPGLLSKYEYPEFPQSIVVADNVAPTQTPPWMLQELPVPVSSTTRFTVIDAPEELQNWNHSEFSTEKGTSCKPSPSRSAPA